MRVDESTTTSKTKGAKSWPTCILNTINKVLDILIDEFLKHLLLIMWTTKSRWCLVWHHLLSHLIGMNQKELQKFKVQINDLMEHGYIRLNMLPYSLILFMDKKDEKL